MGSISVPNGPGGLAFDPSDGYVYVSEEFGAALTAINGSSSQVVSQVAAVGTYPGSVAFDPSNGDLYTTNAGSDNVSIVNGTSGKVSGTIALSVSPTKIIYDPTNGELYVSSDPAGNVTVIKASTDKIVRAVGVGTFPVGEAYDSSNGDIYVANFGSNNVSVISGSSNSVVGSVVVGKEPEAVAYDPTNGDVYVADFGDSNVTVINGSSGSVVASVSVGQPGSEAEAFDSAKGFVYDVINPYSGGPGNLTWLNGSTNQVAGSVDVGTNPRDVVVDSWNDCTYVANVGSNIVSVVPRAFVSVAISASPMVADVGVPIAFKALVVGGIAPYSTYNWTYGDGTSENGTSAAPTHTYQTAKGFTVQLQVTDSIGEVGSAAITVSVHPLPRVSTPRSNLTSADVGQSATFTVLASGGTLPYESVTWYGLGAGCQGGTTSQVTCPFVAAQNLAITATVTDHLGVTSPPSNPLNFTVHPDLAVSPLTANRSSADVGQAVGFKVTASNGSGGYVYAWRGLPAGCAGTTPSIGCKVVFSGTLSVSVEVTDSDGGPAASSSSVSLRVYPDPTVTYTAVRAVLDEGQLLTLNAAGSLGSGGYNFTWSGLPPGRPIYGARVVCNPAAGQYSVNVRLTDTNGWSAISGGPKVVVYPALSLAAPSVSGTPTKGSDLVFRAVASGGSTPVAFSWDFGDGSKAVGSEPDHMYETAGTFTVTVWANDSSGGDAERSFSVAVTGGSTSASIFPVVEAASAAAIVAAGVYLAWRPRRSHGRTGSPRDPTEPPSSPPDD
ncbi:MAG TPA: PKD domain-containing protein [Thermoplasmata archaeon]|nr:PKD domain-containing protein [Thermoplasmata archaeon]